MKNLTVEQIREAIQEHAPTMAPKLEVWQPAYFHIQIRGGDFIVNYYPSKGTVYVNGAQHGFKAKSPRHLVLLAIGDGGMPQDMHRPRRKGMRSYRERMYYPGVVCWLCHIPIATIEEASVEHKVPVSKGGSNRRDNLVLTHKHCNNARGGKMHRHPGPRPGALL